MRRRFDVDVSSTSRFVVDSQVYDESVTILLSRLQIYDESTMTNLRISNGFQRIPTDFQRIPNGFPTDPQRMFDGFPTDLCAIRTNIDQSLICCAECILLRL